MPVMQNRMFTREIAGFVYTAFVSFLPEINAVSKKSKLSRNFLRNVPGKQKTALHFRGFCNPTAGLPVRIRRNPVLP